MRLTKTGAGSPLYDAFLDGSGHFAVTASQISATGFTLTNAATGMSTRFTGFGISDPLGTGRGTITGWVTTDTSGQVLLRAAGDAASNITWPVNDLISALHLIADSDDYSGLDALLSMQNFTYDSSASTDDAGWLFYGVSSNVTIVDGAFGASFGGGIGDDSLVAGGSDLGGEDNFYLTTGHDSINLSQASVGQTNLVLSDLPTLDNLNISIDSSFGQISGSNVAQGYALDTIITGLEPALNDGSVVIWGSDGDESFTLNPGADGFISFSGGLGVDSGTVTLEGIVELNFRWSWYDTASQGLLADLTTGVISNDGFGNAEQLSITGGSGRLQIVATDQSDNILGSDRTDETYYLLGGNDTLAAGGGYDSLHYNWGSFDTGITLDMVTGVVSGTAKGMAFTTHFSGIEDVWGSNLADTLQGSAGTETLDGSAGDDLIRAGDGNDILYGGIGRDTLNAGGGDDFIYAGNADNADLADTIYGGDGNDQIDTGYGNDWASGDIGNDSLIGDFGADTLLGASGKDTLSGGALSDLLFGGDGADYLNGGFGYDRINGGAGADQFYHLGIADHGSDWIQDYSAAEGDVLVFGRSATAADFQINLAFTANAGQANVAEAFVIYRPSGQIIWALVDGGGLDHLDVRALGQGFELVI